MKSEQRSTMFLVQFKKMSKIEQFRCQLSANDPKRTRDSLLLRGYWFNAESLQQLKIGHLSEEKRRTMRYEY